MLLSSAATTTWVLALATGCLALPYKSSSFSTSFSNFTSQKPNPNFASTNFANGNFATNNYTSPNYMSSNWSQTWSQGYQYQYQNPGTGSGSGSGAASGAPAKGSWRPPFPHPPMTPGNPGGFSSNGNSFPQPSGGFASNSGVSRPFYRPPTQQSSAGNNLPPRPANFGSNNPRPPYPPPPQPSAGSSNNNLPSTSSGSFNNNGAPISSGAFNYNPPPPNSGNSPTTTPSVGSSFNAQPVPPGDSNSINPAPPESSSFNSSSPWSVEPLEPNRFGSSSGDQPPKRNSEGTGCRDEGGQQYGVGDKWTPPGSCSRVTCLQDGKTSSLGCPIVEMVENCTLSSGDPRQPWPFCCPQIKCV